MRSKRWASGEVMTFGIPEGTVTSFLEERGFAQVLDADANYLHDTYFTGENSAQNKNAAACYSSDQARRESHKYIRLDVRDDEFRLAIGEARVEIIDCEYDSARESVDSCILDAHCDSLGIVVEAAHVAKAEPRRRQRKYSRAASRIDHTRVCAVCIRERNETLTAQARRLVIACAKSHPGIKPDGRVTGWHRVSLPFPKRHPVHAAAAPRLEVRLVAFAPVLVGKFPNLGHSRDVEPAHRRLYDLPRLERGLARREVTRDRRLARNSILKHHPHALGEIMNRFLGRDHGSTRE